MHRAYPKSLPTAKRTLDKLVCGWYACVTDGPCLVKRHLLIPEVNWLTTEDRQAFSITAIEIDISTAAEDTGKLDKHGKPIFGSRGPMHGGDRVSIGGVQHEAAWRDSHSYWGLRTDCGDSWFWSDLNKNGGLEIVKGVE
ncbi:hypothetical protein KAR91_32435 [Candidatus Pacearchaeota archaeon]|nr:hypothetical protein [Candidatus Pacearchaeota archaeon]